jgi:hypothetical protein
MSLTLLLSTGMSPLNSKGLVKHGARLPLPEDPQVFLCPMSPIVCLWFLEGFSELRGMHSLLTLQNS